MANLIKLASSQIREIILESMGKMVSSGQIPAEPLPDFIVEIPADKSHGDFAANTAMVCARALKMAPRKIAEMICENICLDGTYFEKAEIAGPGFINFFLGRKWFSETIDTVLNEKRKLRKNNNRFGQKDSCGIRFRKPDRSYAYR